MPSKGLTPKQEKFCQVFIETGNASEAYRAAYDVKKMKPNTIAVKASELQKNGKVAVRIDELRSAAMKRHDIVLDDVVRELASIGFANVQQFFREDGSLIPLAELAPEMTAAISEVVVNETVGGTAKKPVINRTTKLKLTPKTPALVKLGEHLGGLVRKFRVDGEVKHTVVDGTAQDVTDEIMGIFEHAAGNSSDDPSSVH